MPAFAEIPTTIVTGCLGAGKTTLIRHILETAGGRRLALLLNEFGDVGARVEKSFGKPWAANEDRAGRLEVIGEKGLDADAIRAALVA